MVAGIVIMAIIATIILIFIIVESPFLSSEVFLTELSLATTLKILTILTAEFLAVFLKLLAFAARFLTILTTAVEALVTSAVQVVAVEGKAQYVGLLVLFLLLQSLLEFAFFLKTVFPPSERKSFSLPSNI